MKEILYDEIPSLDLSDFHGGDPEKKKNFVAALGAAYNNIGFVAIKNHFLTNEMQEKLYQAIKKYFALPDEVKKEHERTDLAGQRGYTGKGKEHAKGRNTGDLKEFYHVARELPPGHKYEDSMPPNIWPAEVESFKATFLELFAAFDRTGARILEAIARHLGLAPDFFVDTVRDGNSVLRLLHYPPTQGGGPNVRAGAHEDINTITLLLGAEEAGLQLLDRDGNWLPVTPKQGDLVVNVGDMLQRLTNHVLKSTSHRVVNPAPERASHARYSMPFFLHFRPDYLIEPLPGCDNHGRAPDAPITAHEFLQERLREIKLA